MFSFYQGKGKKPDSSGVQLPKSQRYQLLSPDKYIADPGLVDACNVALLLNQPLLLTGEPGTGKTQFAYSLSWELGFQPPIKFETKSNSIARDLFYTYDALKRFQDSQGTAGASATLDYIEYQALGLAILKANYFDDIKPYLPTGMETFERQRSVVLIDEVDKAPRDFPNDLLNELDQMYFRIPELGNVAIKADPDFQPIVIITSNSEKDLPDAFLRRCVYYHIPFPDQARLTDIVSNRLGAYVDDDQQFLTQALDLFTQLRQSGLQKPPATAELLGWLTSLTAIAPNMDNPLKNPDIICGTLSSLIKNADDIDKAKMVVQRWSAAQNSST